MLLEEEAELVELLLQLAADPEAGAVAGGSALGESRLGWKGGRVEGGGRVTGTLAWEPPAR